MANYTDIANAFVKELRGLILADFSVSEIRRRWIAIETEEVSAFVKPTIEGGGAEISIHRTIVSKNRVFYVREIGDSEMQKALQAFYKTYRKLYDRRKNIEKKNEEIAHLQPLPSSVYLDRDETGIYTVRFEKKMNLSYVEKFVEFVKNVEPKKDS